MTHRNAKIHPAMTALAAVIALTSTPLLAQSVDEPIVSTTPPIDVTPAPVAADPAPVVDTAADPLAAEAAPATPVRKAAPVKTAAARSRPAAARASSPAVATAPAAVITAPVAEVPVAQPLPPPTEIAAEPIAQPPATANWTMNEMLPAAGIGGAALVLLAGVGLAVRRRRRRAAEAENAEWQYAEADAEATAEPAMVVEPEPDYVEPLRQPAAPAFVAAPAAVVAPAPAAEASPEEEAPVTELPEDFDLSRFGYNVQEAYKGPTEDNPSLSLRHRLRRASGMDQQERKLDVEVEAVTGESVLDDADPTPPAEAPAAKPAAADPATGDFMITGAKKSSVRPANTH